MDDRFSLIKSDSMNSNYNKLLLFAASSVIAAVGLNSCVNKEYAHDKEFDNEIVILKDIDFPIGSLDKISVADIISINDSDQMISQEENGDYSFIFAGIKPFTANFTVPTFSFPLEEGAVAGSHQISINTGSLAGQPGPSTNQKICLENLKVEKLIKVNDSFLLPYQITDIKSLETNTNVKYKFFTSEGAVYVAEGFTMDFPDWLIIEKNDNKNDYVVENKGDNKNVVRFLNDVRIAAANDYTLDFVIKTINFPEGSIVDGGTDSQGRTCKKVAFNNQKIVVEGGVYLQTKDFPTVPQNAELKMQLDFSGFAVQSANMQLNMKSSVADQVVPIAAYPEFFNMEGIVIDLYDPHIVFTANNQLPVSLDFNADLNAYKNSEVALSAHIGDASENGTSKFLIPSSSTSEIEYSALGEGQNVGKLPILRDIVKVLPESISVSDINVATTEDYSDIVPGQSFTCSLDYQLYAPLAFGPDFRFVYTMDIETSLEEFGLKTASMMMKVENTIPLTFNIETQALNSDGNPIESITVQMEGNIAAGVQSSPSENEVKLTLTSADDEISFQSLKFKFTATAPTSQFQGVPLNKNQYINISSVSLKLPEGINIDLN